MADERYEVEITFDTDVGDALDDLDELGDELDDFDDDLEQNTKSSQQSKGALDDMNRALNANFLGFLSGAAVVGGFVTALGFLASQSAAVSNLFDTGQAAVGRWIDTLAGDEIDKATTSIGRLIDNVGTLIDQAEEQSGEPNPIAAGVNQVGQTANILADLIELQINPDFDARNSDLGRALYNEQQKLGEIIDFLFSDNTIIKGNPLEGTDALSFGPPDPVVPNDVSNQTLLNEPQIISPTIIEGQRVTNFDSSDRFQPLPDSNLRPVLPPIQPQAAPLMLHNENHFHGDILDQTEVERRVQRGIDTALRNPHLRGGPLTGGGLP